MAVDAVDARGTDADGLEPGGPLDDDVRFV